MWISAHTENFIHKYSLYTTEVAIAEIPESKKDSPSGGMGGMDY